MIIDNSHTIIKVLETKTVPVKKTEKKKKTEQIKIENKTILENVLPLTEKQRAEAELFKKLINS